MRAPKTAKLLNDLLDSQKADRARLKQLEGRLAEVNIQQAVVTASEMQCKAQLDRMQQEHAAEHATLTELVATKDWQIIELKQALGNARQLLAAADASNVELCTIIEKLDDATQEAANLADARAEIVKQREDLNHLLDEVRGHMRKKDYDRERALLNRGVLARAAPRLNLK